MTVKGRPQLMALTDPKSPVVALLLMNHSLNKAVLVADLRRRASVAAAAVEAVAVMAAAAVVEVVAVTAAEAAVAVAVEAAAAAVSTEETTTSFVMNKSLVRV